MGDFGCEVIKGSIYTYKSPITLINTAHLMLIKKLFLKKFLYIFFSKF